MLPGLVLVLALAALVRPLLVVPDGVGHLVYLRSALFDGDLHFANEYAVWRVGIEAAPVTETGFVGNPFAVGSAILWLPFYLLAHGTTWVGHLIDPLAFSLDGYSELYLGVPAFGSAVYGVAALALSYRTACRLVNKRAAALGTAAAALGTPFIFYFLYGGLLSHIPSAFAVSLFLYVWLEHRSAPSIRSWCLLGALGGLVALVRWQDAVWLIVPVADAFAGRWERRNLHGHLLYLGAALLAFSPQLVVWHALYGFWFGLPQESAVIASLRPEVTKLLFSSHHGLFTHHPATVLAGVGLGALVARQRRVGGLLVLGMALEVWAAAVHDVSGGVASGARRMVSCTPVFAAGFAALFDAATSRDAAVAAGRLAASGAAGSRGEASWYPSVVAATVACTGYSLLLMLGMLTRRLPGEAYTSFADLIRAAHSVVLSPGDALGATLEGPSLFAATPALSLLWVLVGGFVLPRARWRGAGSRVAGGMAMLGGFGVCVVAMLPIHGRELLPLEQRRALAFVSREGPRYRDEASVLLDRDLVDAVARAHHGLGQWSAAAALHERVVAMDGGDLNALTGLGVCALHTDRTGRVAERWFRAALEVDPRLATGWYHLGLSLEFQHRFAEALRCHDAAIAYDPNDARARAAAARVHRHLGHHDDARRELSFARALAATDPLVLEVGERIDGRYIQ